LKIQKISPVVGFSCLFAGLAGLTLVMLRSLARS